MNHKKIRYFIVLLIIQVVIFPNIIWADQWNKTILNTEISLDRLSLTNYFSSPDNNWLIYLPDYYVKTSFISINLGAGRQMPTIGYSDPFEKGKRFKWTIFWKSENEAILRKSWKYEVSFHNWKNEVYYYELTIHGMKVSVNKLNNVPDKNIKFVDIYSEKHDFESFSDTSSFDTDNLASRHPEIAFKESGLNSLQFYYAGNLVSEHKKRSVMMFFRPSSQKPGFDGLAISPDNEYIFYGIHWFGGDWNVGPSYLYLLDIKKKNVTLIDEHYISDTMVWTRDSKKFIYRRSNEKNDSVQLVLITF